MTKLTTGSATKRPRVDACVLSYKLADVTNATVDLLHRQCHFNLNSDLFVFENRENPYVDDEPLADRMVKQVELDLSWGVTHFTGANLRMTGGFNYICDWLQSSGFKLDVVWLCTNDFQIPNIENSPDVKVRIQDAFMNPSPTGKPVGWWHPSKTRVEGYAFPWMHNQLNPQATTTLRSAWMTDFICPAIRWDLLKAIRAERGYWFDPRFYRGWGIDYETCYLIRKMGYDVVVDDAITINHESSATYIRGLAPESKEQFYDKAIEEMRMVLTAKYGPNWLDLFKGEYREG
ncbi:MAG: hypothetical protein E6R03_15015 [Hyphomicrobiaceae bacterium]|nr:MAG: hypothetical protein E6R03_15015 [Hyphomicrobiaceae bacterium]